MARAVRVVPAEQVEEGQACGTPEVCPAAVAVQVVALEAELGELAEVRAGVPAADREAGPDTAQVAARLAAEVMVAERP